MPKMASKPPTKEELAQVRRMRAQKPWVSPEAIIQAAARTPNITRFTHAKQRRLGPASNEASPIITSPGTTLTTRHRRSSARPVQTKRSSGVDEIKARFTSSKRVHDKDKALSVAPSNGPLPHTPITPRPESIPFSRLKERRDIYEFPEDGPSNIAVPAQKSLPWLHHRRPSSKLLCAEQDTSNFRFSNTLPSHETQESGTIEEGLNNSDEATVSEVARNEAPHGPLQSVHVSRLSKKAITEPQKIQSRPQQDKQLVNISSEILHPGQDNQALPSAAFPTRPKRLRSATEKEISEDFGLFLDGTDGGSDVNAQEPLPKKRRRSSRWVTAVEARKTALQELNRRQASKGNRKSVRNHIKLPKTYSTSQKLKKKKRRIPVNELVTATERPIDSSVDMTSSRHAELSDDTISQLAHEDELDKHKREHLNPSLRMKINNLPRKRIRAIDISLFRMPKNRSNLTATRVQQQANSCSDGFEGKEAAPTGVYMPVKRPARRFEPYQRFTIKFGQLTLVPEKPSDAFHVEQGHLRIGRIQRYNANPTLRPHIDSENPPGDAEQDEPSLQPLLREYCLSDRAEVQHDKDQILKNDQDEEMEAELGACGEDLSPTSSLPKQNSPNVSSEVDISEAHIRFVSPLERKQCAIHVEKMASQKLQRALKTSSQSIQGTLVGMEDFRLSQQLAIASTKKSNPLRVRTESLEIAQELKMVSVQRRARKSQYDSDNSDEGSEGKSAESYSEFEHQGEETCEEDEEVLTPEDDSEEDKNEVEEEQPRERNGDETQAENRGLYLPDPVSTGFQASRATAVTSVKQDASVVAEGIQRLLLTDQESAGSRDNIVINPFIDLQRIASQGLQVLSPSSQRLLSLSEIDGPGSKDNETALNGTSFQQNDPRGHLGDHDLDNSWHPRIPMRSGLALEVDEEIVDSANSSPVQNRQSLPYYSSRRLSRTGSKQLTMVRSHRNSPMPEDESLNAHETQESVELGDPQRIAHHSPSEAVLETQTSNQPEIPETQFLIEPQKSYLERALGLLREPIDNLSLSRIKSLPAQGFSGQQEQSGDAVAGGFAMLGEFKHPTSLVETTHQMQNVLEGSANAGKSLSALTRQASLNMGTLPGSTRKRVASFQLTRPPFVRSSL